MKKYLYVPITLLLSVCFSGLSIAQTIDTYALDQYWDLVEPLKKGDSLTTEKWKAFLEIEANKIYVENQAFDSQYLERLRKTIEYVYMPKYDSLLTARVAAIKKDTASYWMTYKVYVYKEFETELKNYQRQLKDPFYLDKIYKHTFRWLPKNLQVKDPSAIIRFIGIENDAIAGNGLVISTLWSAYNQDKLETGILMGHEMHHNLRNPFNFNDVQENDQGIIYALKGILNEGSADMVDKDYAVEHDKELPMGVKMKEFLLTQSDSIISQMDLNLQAMENSQGKVFKTEREYRDLMKWTSGHNPGYYMAKTIVNNGYEKQFLKNIRNPFVFVYLYNKAAKKSKKVEHIFSDTSMKYVKLLEKKYWNKRTPNNLKKA